MRPRPILETRALLYADHHATTPLDPEVFEAMRPWLAGLAGNPSSVHGPGRAARAAVERARDEVAALLNADAAGIVFTSGGTEADNLAVRGGARAAREADPARLRVFFTAAEHAAVREAAHALSPEGFVPLELPVDARGVPLGAAPADSTTALVSVILANNETGAVFDGLPSFAEKTRRAGALVHTDAVQASGKIPVDAAALGVDLLSIAAHKFGGPKGAGALWVRPGVRVFPLAAGGGQERGRRGGTENVAALVGLGEAARLARRRLAAEGARLAALRDRLEAGLLAAVPLARVNAAGGARLPTASSIVFPGAEAETLVAALDLEGIAVSAGSACHAGTTAPSRVLLALGLSAADAKSTLRISFGRPSTEEDVDRLLEAVPRVVARARRAART
ncbi:MAG TPA: cysteine desulfurase family protein [Thermoanaerobaculia bacterium]|nr:cysteine desulfurase family protein [Thermoanaerobaculia bacterium]